jgi:hypothetical protein
VNTETIALNERLGKFAGVLVSIESWPDEEPTMCVYDTEQENLIGECSPFTESLDACFLWLVPKCGHVGMSTQGDNFDVSVWTKDADSEYDGIMVREATPALALCKAIEKMIDTEAA